MSLNQLQRDECCVADSVDIWKKLLENFRNMGTEGHEWLEMVEKIPFQLSGFWPICGILATAVMR